jgi:hypothetical protein
MIKCCSRWKFGYLNHYSTFSLIIAVSPFPGTESLVSKFCSEASVNRHFHLERVFGQNERKRFKKYMILVHSKDFCECIKVRGAVLSCNEIHLVYANSFIHRHKNRSCRRRNQRLTLELLMNKAKTETSSFLINLHNSRPLNTQPSRKIQV